MMMTLNEEQRKAISKHRYWLEDEIKRREIAMRRGKDADIEKEIEDFRKRLKSLG